MLNLDIFLRWEAKQLDEVVSVEIDPEKLKNQNAVVNVSLWMKPPNIS